MIDKFRPKIIFRSVKLEYIILKLLGEYDTNYKNNIFV